MSQDARRVNNSFRSYKREQAAISRRRLYPVTAFYTAYSIILLVLASRSAHPFWAVAFYLAGIPVWTLVEYLTHRYILHGRFQKSNVWYKKWYKDFAHQRLDPLHWEHHERPSDGMHINGVIKDLLPLFAVCAPLSFLLFPFYSAPMLLAGVTQSYLAEEWIHHSIHYYNLRNPFFRYIKAYHLYHHTSQGMQRGYGISSGFWDIIFKTRFPDHVQKRLTRRGRHSAVAAHNRQAETLDSAARSFQE
jgi:sterol desaturase/sphingolipid hydroxylase (fatty acid hydroxylase superfamily)